MSNCRKRSLAHSWHNSEFIARGLARQFGTNWQPCSNRAELLSNRDASQSSCALSVSRSTQQCMAVYLDAVSWRYRATIRLPDGTRKRISGTPDENTKAAAEEARDRHARSISTTVPEKWRTRIGPIQSSPRLNAHIFRLPRAEWKTLSTNQKGAASEARATSHLIQAGYGVSVATGALRYDLVIQLPNGKLKKVQVKTGHVWRDKLKFNPHTIISRGARSPARLRKYSVDEVDFFAVYSPEIDATFLIPNTGNVPGTLSIVKVPTYAAPERKTRKKENSTIVKGAVHRTPNTEIFSNTSQSSCVTSTPPIV